MHEHDGALAAHPLSEIRRWCERHLIVGDGPLAGSRFRVGGGGQGRAPIPAWRDVIDSFDDPEVEQSTIRGSVQSGKTASLIAASLFHMSKGRSILLYEPDDKLKRTLAARIVAWARLCEDEAIQAAYTPKRPPFVRLTGAGGRLEVISAKEGGASLMRTAEIVVVDELRAFHADLLGELVDRMAAYGGRGRLITASSAGYEDECRTSTELGKSDSRRWFVRCPACDRENIADWKNVIYKGRENPVYSMPCCGAELGGVRFRHAVTAGRWKPTKAPLVPGTVGFHVDAFLSPFESLATVTRQWKRADAHRKQTGSMAEVIAFQCGRLAVPFKPTAAQGVTPEGIASSCREDYDPNIVPAEASIVVAAADTQDNRVEVELSAWGVVEVGTAEDASNVKGWGSHEFRGLAYGGKWYRLRRWALDLKRFPGDPGSPELWNEVAKFVETPIRHASGPMLRPVTVGIDSGGHYADAVAEFAKAGGPAYQSIKGLGRHRFDGFLARRSVTSDVLDRYGPNGLLLVGGNECKASVFSLLRQSIAGAEPKPMVWPNDESRYGVEEFTQIVSETLVRVMDKRTGSTTLVWKKIGRENEALDLLCYSLGIVHHLGIPFLLSEAEAIRKAVKWAA